MLLGWLFNTVLKEKHSVVEAVVLAKNLCCIFPYQLTTFAKSWVEGETGGDLRPSSLSERRGDCGMETSVSQGIIYSVPMYVDITGLLKTLREAVHPSGKVCLLLWFWKLTVLTVPGNPEKLLMFSCWSESDFYAQLKCFILSQMQLIWKLIFISGNIY